MADLIDDANKRAQEMLEDALAKRKPAGPPAPTGNAHCLNCDAPVVGKRWCDADCRDEWERIR